MHVRVSRKTLMVSIPDDSCMFQPTNKLQPWFLASSAKQPLTAVHWTPCLINWLQIYANWMQQYWKLMYSRVMCLNVSHAHVIMQRSTLQATVQHQLSWVTSHSPLFRQVPTSWRLRALPRVYLHWWLEYSRSYSEKRQSTHLRLSANEIAEWLSVVSVCTSPRKYPTTKEIY